LAKVTVFSKKQKQKTQNKKTKQNKTKQNKTRMLSQKICSLRISKLCSPIFNLEKKILQKKKGKTTTTTTERVVWGLSAKKLSYYRTSFHDRKSNGSLQKSPSLTSKSRE